jgi:hypothetical protein
MVLRMQIMLRKSCHRTLNNSKITAGGPCIPHPLGWGGRPQFDYREGISFLIILSAICIGFYITIRSKTVVRKMKEFLEKRHDAESLCVAFPVECSCVVFRVFGTLFRGHRLWSVYRYFAFNILFSFSSLVGE